MLVRIFLAAIAVCIGIWLRRRREHFNLFKQLNIPGPEPSIIFGNAWVFWRSDSVDIQKEWIKKYGKVLGYFYGHRPVLLVADADLLKQIQVKDFSDFVDRGSAFIVREPPPPENRSLTIVRGKRWKELRSIMTPSFTTTKLKMMSPQMTDSIDSLVKVIEEKARTGEEFDIYTHYQALTMEVICRTAFGVHKELQQNPHDPLIESVKRVFYFPISLIFIILVAFPELGFAFRLLREILLRMRNRGANPVTDLLNTAKDIIDVRKADPSKRRVDLLQLLIDAQHTKVDLNNLQTEHLTAGDEADSYAERKSSEDADQQNGELATSKKTLDDDDITMNTFVVLAAGYETTSNTLASITHLLVHHPDVQEKVREEIKGILDTEGVLDYNSVQKMKYLDCVISESLRMYPPVHAFVTREALTDKEYGNLKIPKGLVVQIPVKFIHYDPDYWPNPEKFNPDRFLPENKKNNHPMAFQAFGEGPRNCVGMRFAQMEMKLALVRLLEKFRFQATDKTDVDPPKLIVDLILARMKNVYVKAVPV